MLGEIGKGHKVAFNVLNYGRFKLARDVQRRRPAVIGEAARYAAERKQFGQPIACSARSGTSSPRWSIREYARRERCSTAPPA